MSVTPYGTAIRDAIIRGELREMKALLAQAKGLLKKQGDLGKAIVRLEKAIVKASARKRPAKR